MEASPSTAIRPHQASAWERWLHHPETLRFHRVLFHIHLWIGMIASAYLLCMSVSGSAIVFRNELEISASPDSRLFRAVEWLVDLHGDLLLPGAGRWLNGVGAIFLTLICATGAVIWWPGVAHWRRGLIVNWRSSFARINWDLHHVLGFWCFLFVLIWGISGIYFCFPQSFSNVVYVLTHALSTKPGRADVALLWLSGAHFGRLNIWTEVLWALIGLSPAILAFTGMFMCCHRLLIRKGAPLPR